ncbi:MAG: DJ-1/PfpI family protein [Planctomycetota bacterium]
MSRRNLAILLFENAEVLDFCGPFEVFSVANERHQDLLFNVFTVAEAPTIKARNGLSVNADYCLENCPPPQILLVPGGIGTRTEINNLALTNWIRRTSDAAELVLSVCTGALLLGKAGLLDDLDLTTHHVAYDRLRDLVPSATVHEDQRFVDNGKVITSAGIAAGIDMSLHVVERLHGSAVATATASHMEYPWNDPQP